MKDYVFNKRIAFMEVKEIMTVKQVAEYLQMDEHTVYKLARSGQIPSLKIAGQWRFKKDVIDKWISEESLERSAKFFSIQQKGKKKIR
jgi:excisionase family DNA binding protein